MRRNRTRMLSWARVLLSVAALGAVIWKTDIGETSDALRSAHVGLAAAGVALNICGVLLSTALWRLFVTGPRPVYPVMVRSYLRGLFLNNVGLGTVVGDAARAADTRGESGLKSSSASVIHERVVSLIALLLLAVAGSVGWLTVEPRIAGGVGALAATAIAVLVFGAMVARALSRSAWCPTRARDVFRWGSEVASSLVAERRRFVVALAIAVGVQATTVGATYMMLAAAGAEAGWREVVSLTPVVALAVLLPFSVQGIGVREASYVQIFGLAGVAAPVALSAAALSYASTLLVSLAGGVLMLTGARSRSEAPVMEAAGARPVHDLAA